MRRQHLRIALLAGGVAALAGAAMAADLSDPVWTQGPDRDQWAKAYPAEAAKAGVSGTVSLRCAAGPDGTLQNCAVAQESPSNEGIGAAALSLTPEMQLRATGQAGEFIAGRQVVVPVKFDPQILRPFSVITNPDWMRKPGADEMVQFWPAKSGGAAGKVKLECVVSRRGLLEDCSVTSETPTGHGFGDSALAMSSIFVMRPMTVDGQPVGGSKVEIPIGFQGGGYQPPSGPGTTVTVLSVAPWAAAPTIGQMAQAYPRSQLGKVASARVVLRCALKSDGGLNDCDTLSEAPHGAGFANAAKSLVRDFHVLGDAKIASASGWKIDVPFDFEDPSRVTTPIEIYDPLWLKQVNPASVVSLFPPEAIKAGVKSGATKLDCAVAADGGLKDCAVVSEDPAGLGFGEAALTIAGVMQMNPWSRQGAPVEGAHIILPIKLVQPTDAATPSAPPAKP